MHEWRTRSTTSGHRGSGLTGGLLITALLVLTPATVRAQEAALTATVRPEAGQWMKPDDVLTIELSRPLDPADGRPAVLIGATDWTGLARVTASAIEIRPGPIRLPRGRSDLVVYVVSAGNTWREVGTFAIAVLTEGGFERAEARPSAEVNIAGRPARGSAPPTEPGPRDTFFDTTARAGLETTHERYGWATTSQLHVVGVSYRNEALRFGQDGDAAPLVDLADYSLGIRHNRVIVGVGHGAWGTHRQLVNAFSSRGATTVVRLGPALDLSLAAMNGSSVVGFDNPLGLSNGDHRVLGATVGVEAVPTRPGALRVAASFLDGSVLPIAGFTQGAVQDAERSRGVGFQVIGSDAAGRFQIDSGYARSRFTNPFDPLLAGDVAVVGVDETTRQARYVDVRYAIVEGASLGAATSGSLSVAFRHNRVDPLYRSVALSLASDVHSNAVDVTAGIGPATSQVSYERLRDNLAEIDSILTTRTRVLTWTNAVPLAGFAGATTRAAAYPTLSYTLNRTHQEADGLPVNGLFDSLSQVPDQVSLVQTVGAAWQAATWRAAYALNRSLQDNRQVGRELADLVNMVHAVQLGLSPTARLELNLDVAFEGADNREFETLDLTRRVTVNATVRPAAKTSLGGAFTVAFVRNDPATNERRTTDFNVQLSQSVALWPARPGALQGQAFVRFARQHLWTFVRPASTRASEHAWTLNTGVTLKVF